LEKLFALVITAAIAAIAILAARSGHVRYGGAIEGAVADLAAPDAYIATPALSRLPRDLVKAPLARELLTEDFAFYYEEHEDRLAIQGVLKRIAWEHDVTLEDRLLQVALDEPAEVALWKDAKGAPRYWLIAMTRGPVARALQQAVQIAAGDAQFSVLGELPDATPVYALTLSSRRTYALVARGDRVVVLSDPGLLFDTHHELHDAAAKVVTALLSADASEQALYRRHFGLDATGPGHVLVADSSLLSFGYRHFFPGLRALRLDVPAGGGELRMQLRVGESNTLPAPAAAQALWSGVPLGAAACSWLPVDWRRARAVLELIEPPSPDVEDAASGAAASSEDAAASDADATSDEEAASRAASARAKSAARAASSAREPDGAPGDAGLTKSDWMRFAANLDGPAAICWYPRSQFQTPLVIARTRADAPPQAVDEALAAIGDWLIPGGAAEAPPMPGAPSARRWQQEVDAPWGPYGGASRSFYRPTLAADGAWIAFSPDDTLVDLAISTQERRFPSVADTLPPGGAALAIVAPAKLADLVQREAFAVLPPQQELLRQAAEAHLVPRLETLRHWPAVRASATGTPSTEGWVTIAWQPLAGAPQGAGAGATAASASADRTAAKQP
jgi:uncharacterized protein YfaA (DUF2138 family)